MDFHRPFLEFFVEPNIIRIDVLENSQIFLGQALAQFLARGFMRERFLRIINLGLMARENLAQHLRELIVQLVNRADEIVLNLPISQLLNLRPPMAIKINRLAPPPKSKQNRAA